MARADFDVLMAKARVEVQEELAARCVDLMCAVELADTRTGSAEEKDGMVEVYSLRASDWNRVVAVARGHMSQKARRSLDTFRRKLERDGTDWLRKLPRPARSVRGDEVSITAWYDVWCDEATCIDWTVGGPTRAAAAKAAREAGWRRERDGWRCPFHRARLSQPVASEETK